jgi:hypothetical protein
LHGEFRFFPVCSRNSHEFFRVKCTVQRQRQFTGQQLGLRGFRGYGTLEKHQPCFPCKIEALRRYMNGIHWTGLCRLFARRSAFLRHQRHAHIPNQPHFSFLGVVLHAHGFACE